MYEAFEGTYYKEFARCVTNNDLNLYLVIYTNRLMHACQVFRMYVQVICNF
jgi:hypothetical protein